MSDRDLTPTEGARVLLERLAVPSAISAAAAEPPPSDSRATYRVAIFTPAATFDGTATLADDGTVVLAITAPAELVAMLEMQAKLVARGAAKRRADGLPPWPARVLRWRGPGRGE